MSKVYMYVVDRDFGFAPNPFHGCCTLATCKPVIRRTANIGDWVIGMGGASRLKATGRCVFAMRVTEALSFNEYWKGPLYLDKKPIRNGSRTMMVGDNIYHYDAVRGHWHQEDSHHSLIDGTINVHNQRADTKTDRVLVSRHFYYFGASAPVVPQELLDAIGYQNNRGHRVFSSEQCHALIEWLNSTAETSLNIVCADPFDFDNSDSRYSVKNNRIT